MTLELLGWSGALLLLSALAMSSLRPLAAPRIVAFVNVVGGACLSSQAMLIPNYSVALLNAVWVILSAAGLWTLRTRRSTCITVGGASASGKTSLVRAVRDQLISEQKRATTLETGRMYRAIARHLQAAGVALDNEQACLGHLSPQGLSIQADGTLSVNGRVVATDGTEAEGHAAATVARHPRLRAMVVRAIRRFIIASAKEDHWVIADARDGPVLCPSAQHFWVQCPIEVRAARRAAQTGEPVADIMRRLAERDAADRGFGRIHSNGLGKVKGIVVLDGTQSLGELVAQVLTRRAQRGGK